MTARWCWSDAWFFEAVAWAQQSSGADLAGVMVSGDAINHAVFTATEVEGAVHRLTYAGLVEELARRFTLTARGSSLRRPAESRGVHERMNWLELQFRRLPLPEGEPVWHVTEPEWQAAVD